MRSTSRILRLALLAASLCGAPAFACSISVSGVPFGAYDTLSPSAVITAAQIEIDCQKGNQQPEVALGTGAAGSYAPREMGGPPDVLQYNLFTNATYTTVWGDGRGGTSTVWPAEVRNKSFRATIYGRIPGGQNVHAGSYSDTVFITVNF